MYLSKHTVFMTHNYSYRKRYNRLFLTLYALDVLGGSLDGEIIAVWQLTPLGLILNSMLITIVMWLQYI